MCYKIAMATSDGVHIDKSFGAADSFIIYEVDGENYEKTDVRICPNFDEITQADYKANGCNFNSCGNGCSGQNSYSSKVELISDCRCVVCLKIGFHIQKQLERKAISAFDVNCTVQEALKKITAYYRRIDKHLAIIKS